MNKRASAYLRNIPSKPYDLIREGLIVLGVILLIAIVLAAVLGSPDYPTVRSEDVARYAPVALLKTSAGILAGKSSLQDYGPPYSADPQNAQRLLGIAPANWFGVTNPIDPAEDLILKPLERAAVLDADVEAALSQYRAATKTQRQQWLSAYLAALDQAQVSNGEVKLPDGQYGPVEVMMQGMLNLGKAGLLEGAIDSGPSLPYLLDTTRSLLFFQDDVDQSVAQKLDMLGEQWGMSHETGPYPGGWWLWPFVFLYQIPAIADSPNADIIAAAVLAVAYLILIFLPLIPGLRDVPRRIGVHKLIWRDWYSRSDSSPSMDAKDEEGVRPDP